MFPPGYRFKSHKNPRKRYTEFESFFTQIYRVENFTDFKLLGTYLIKKSRSDHD